MSHAEGQVRFADGLVLFAEYNGTSDLFCTRLHPTFAEMWENWRKDTYRKCTCGKDEPVELANDYGGGAEFAGGRACRHCLAITDDPSLWDYDAKVKIETSGRPDWWVKHESTDDC